MRKQHIENILNVWEKHNSILKPSKAKMAMEIVDQIASTFSAGSFYYYILNFATLKMEYVDESIRDVLGIEPHEFQLDKLFDYMHPEDLQILHKKEQEALNFLLKTIPTDEIPLYKVVYLMRFRHPKGIYKTVLHQAQAINVSEDGKVQQVIGVHTDISYLPIPFDHKVSFISNERPCYYSIVPDIPLQLLDESISHLFTSKETLVLKQLAEGKDYKQIADALGISPHTVNTHKRNILEKSHSKTVTELIAKCIRAGLI
ncbi:LuxR C-terminal-related transcriptional regulator [Maribellus sediminis]|uniref:LuxR C-terminal-related transcriptional regulator n=1 Tax=Maribellus sediminis TaxID=2696285 RepID=UPI001431959A|nr:LuxR C-terminal-related transcriptional regulator [Maribellus sediminis]